MTRDEAAKINQLIGQVLGKMDILHAAQAEHGRQLDKIAERVVQVEASVSETKDIVGAWKAAKYLSQMWKWFAALETSTNYDIFVPLHTDATIGVEGACPNDPGPYGTYFSDGIHCLNAGYTVLKDFWSPYYDDAVALL